MKKIINLKIKFREGFRPFAPSIIETNVNQFFSDVTPNKYMLFVTKVVESICADKIDYKKSFAY